MSPLFFDHPEAQRFVDFEKDKLCTPTDITRAMIALCQDDERFPPGMVLEVTHPDQWREVFLLSDPGSPPASLTSNKERAIVNVITALEADRNGRA
jgi:hypothetical protein